ncbi:Predicted arabinose efflux permease, MFS family [Bryocella elongata]|uniref:Predicted arabinose efflux permease, MFS family n=1 Tax=Bryocella elongata TaxID=863522 RepID=A0A1H5UPY9_9BACT|nr:MFS transporter [Bryocella elongata]SEF77163.1 Predicted arabinose efflux permease, MFS family [Bryocella elongata]
MKLNNRWLVVFMLWTVCFLNYADRQAIFVVFPLFEREFSLNNFYLGVLSASFMGTYAITGPLAGWACDRLPRRNLVIGALVLWSAMTALSSLAHTYTQLLLGIAMAGVGEAFYFPSAMSLISDYHAVDTRSRAMAFHQSGVYAGSIIGGWLAGVLGQRIGWRIGFRGFGGAGILLGLLLYLLLREPPRGLSDPNVGPIPRGGGFWQSLCDLAANRIARLLVVVFIGANFVAMVFTVWMPTYLFTRFHLSLSVAGLSGTAYMQIASILGVILGGIAADSGVRHGSGPGATRMRVQAMGLLCAVPALCLSGWATRVAYVLAAMVGFGLCKGVYEASLWASLHDVVPIEQRGSSVGLMNSLGWLGAAGAQLLVGYASERFSMGACLSATAIIYFCIAVTLLYSARLTQREGISQTSAT